MRIVFMSSDLFGLPAMQALINEGHPIVACYTTPPAVVRGKPKPNPVHEAAEQQHIPVRTPRMLVAAEVEHMRSLRPDFIVVASYGLLLPPAVLQLPKYKCLNLHPSLLPRWRGAAPVQRAILAGDREAGVCLMEMAEELDAGPIYLTARTPINETTPAGILTLKLAEMGAAMLPAAVHGIATDHYDGTQWQAVEQDHAQATYAKKIEKSELQIDFTETAETVCRKIMAFAPKPGAWCEIKGERVKLLLAAEAAGTGAPGEILDADLTVACGEGAVQLLSVQRPGRTELDGAEFYRGRHFKPGQSLLAGRPIQQQQPE